MKKTIVIFSNPFGYGPTGKAIAIAEAFINRGYKNIIFAGNSFVQEIIPGYITSICVNERNEDEIIKMLRQIKNPVVISSQNRFAIRVAKSLGLRSAFLDGLSWFWKQTPTDHLIADEIFWMDYPHIKDKLPKNFDKIHIVPGIIDVRADVGEQTQILIHIGGCKNPLDNTFPKYYLDILTGSLSNLSDIDKILITGGSEAIEYLKSKLPKNRMRMASLRHHEFIQELSKSKHLITTAGQTATLEAFALGIPTSFLMPMNLSQLALVEILDQYNAAPQSLSWSSYCPGERDPASLNEKDAIIESSKCAEKIYRDKQIRARLEGTIRRMIVSIPDQRGQKEFIKYLGKDGADVIVDTLIKKWNIK